MKTITTIKSVLFTLCISLLLGLGALSACQPHDPFAYAHYRVQRRQIQEELEGLRRQLIRYPDEQTRSTYRALRRELDRIERKMFELRGA